VTGERVGVLFALRDDPDLAVRAEALGYESVWAAEGQGRSAFGKLERWACHTESIGLATGIVNVFSRTPAALAGAAATLDAHSGGRAILGLGVAHPGVVEAFHGARFERPLARMAEYIELVRRYLRGDPGGFDGEFYAPARTHFWEAFEEALGWLAEGAERAGRDVADVDVAMYVLTAVHEDPDRARRAAAEHVAYYLREIPGYYGRVARDAGFGDDVDAVRDAPTTEAGADRISDTLLDRLAVVGTPDEVRDELAALREIGVDLPIVRAPAGADHEWVERTLRTFAPR